MRNGRVDSDAIEFTLEIAGASSIGFGWLSQEDAEALRRALPEPGIYLIPSLDREQMANSAGQRELALKRDVVHSGRHAKLRRRGVCPKH